MEWWKEISFPYWEISWDMKLTAHHHLFGIEVTIA
jgi:hypothetical protein